MNDNHVYNLIIIGGGASGLFFAANSNLPHCSNTFHGSNLSSGLILEKTDKVGTKLLMSGGGRCNITHGGSIKDFISKYGESGAAIRKILYKHSNLELLKFLKDNGMETYEEDDGRVFPVSEKASDVLNMLVRKSRGNGFTIKTGVEVLSITRRDDAWEITCETNTSGNNKERITKTVYKAKKVVIATGGCSYPTSGSDGKMFDILKRDLGIHITELTPALYPIKVEGYPYSDISGLSLNAQIRCGKKKYFGDLLFTHNSFSGPSAINLSSDLKQGDNISINYLHPHSTGEVFDKLQAATLGNKSSLANIINSTFDLPKNFSRIIAERCNGSTKLAARLLTEDSFRVSGSGSFKNAMVTKGGVSLNEVDLSTMELKSHPGIYVIGEALDVNGETGGYNLQFAYSSSCVAATSLGAFSL